MHPPKNAKVIFCNVVTGTYPKMYAKMFPMIMPMNPYSIYNNIKIFQSDLRIFKLFHTLLSDNPALIRSNPPTIPSFIIVTIVFATISAMISPIIYHLSFIFIFYIIYYK